MHIRLSIALLAYRLERPSASSTADNPNPQEIHLRNPKISLNKPSQFYGLPPSLAGSFIPPGSKNCKLRFNQLQPVLEQGPRLISQLKSEHST